LIVTSSGIAEEVIENLKKNNYAGYTIAGAVLMDDGIAGIMEEVESEGHVGLTSNIAVPANSESEILARREAAAAKAVEKTSAEQFGKASAEQSGKTPAKTMEKDNCYSNYVGGVPIVATSEKAAMYVCREWIDEVIVVPAETTPFPQKLVNELQETGVTIHLNLARISNEPEKKQIVEKVGGYTVLTTSINYASARQLFLKRMMDIAAGIVGCILTGVIFIFVAPVIYIQSPGPIFFSQERVGKNGKKFKLYKFRSMYLDAETRKEELLKENKMADGKMFKMDFDPRVIGNKILPDGRKKKGFGQFLRDSSLDEFPQFFNVLKGEMSLVGTRPPLPGEVSEYELHHRARLAIKPGITGMWQVSGRSDITDFEEVVRLDKKYISEWNIWLDIKILFKTVWVVLFRKGAE